MESKAWMTNDFFYEMDISQVAKSLDENMSSTNHPLLILYGHGFHVTLHSYHTSTKNSSYTF